MTMATEDWPAAIPTSRPTVRGLGHLPSTIAVAVGAALLTFLILGSQFAAVWQSGAFFDTDDAMRLVEVRALLHGQSWFDMTATTMDPPHGVFMHWSRVVDVPLAILIKLFGLITDEVSAERLARLAFPFSLLVGLYLGMARLAAVLLGPAARIPAIGATLLSGNGVSQFVPGRIHHSVPQVVILVLMLGAAVAALAPGKARLGAVAGLAAALSLSISLENLPFIVGLCVALTLIWVWQGAAAGQLLTWYGVALGFGLSLVFAVTVAPSRYLLPVCDALGAAHVGAGLVFAMGCGAAALAGARLSTRTSRFAAAALVAVIASAFVAWIYPACLHDPYAAVDPLVREIWLSNVEEALPFPRFLRDEPDAAWPSIVPVVLGLIACLVATCRTEGRQRLQFLLVTVFVAIGLAMALWQTRVFTSITAIALCGGLYVTIAAYDWCRTRGAPSLASLALTLIFPFTATATSLERASFVPTHVVQTPSLAKALPGSRDPSFDDCLAPQAFAPLRSLSGSVVAPVDAGSYLLADTPLTVFAAAYHRNNDGNRFAMDLMSASPTDARRLSGSRALTYVMICPGLSETRRIARRSPDGLAAALLADQPPSWLERMPLADTPYRVFRVHLMELGSTIH